MSLLNWWIDPYLSNCHTVEKWIIEWLKGQLLINFQNVFYTLFLSFIHWTAVPTPQIQNNLLNRLMDRPIKCLIDQLPTNWQKADWPAEQLCDGVILWTGWLIVSLITSDWLTEYNGQVDGCTDWLLTACFDKPISVLHFQTTLIYILQYHANHGIDWLIDWLIDCKNGLTGGLMNWHVEFDYQRNRWTNWITDWWIDSLTDWLTEGVTNWLTD